MRIPSGITSRRNGAVFSWQSRVLSLIISNALTAAPCLSMQSCASRYPCRRTASVGLRALRLSLEKCSTVVESDGSVRVNIYQIPSSSKIVGS